MNRESATMLKYSAAGVFVGVIFTIMIGVNGGFLVSKSNAEHIAHSAVLSAEADICVAQFTRGPSSQERLREFKALNFTQRDEYLEKGGWDRMPGAEKADSDVSRNCAEKLARLVDK